MSNAHLFPVLSVTACLFFVGCTADSAPEDTDDNQSSTAGAEQITPGDSPEITEQSASEAAEPENEAANLSPEQKIREKIAHGVALLNEERFEDFSMAFMKPSVSRDAGQVKKRTEQLANSGLPPLMIEAFASTSDKEAVAKSDGTISFALDKPLGSVNELVFCEIAGDWYLSD